MSEQKQTEATRLDPSPLVAFTGSYFAVAKTQQTYELHLPTALQCLLEHCGEDDLSKLHTELSSVCDLLAEHVVDKIHSKDFKNKYRTLKGVQAMVQELFEKIKITQNHG